MASLTGIQNQWVERWKPWQVILLFGGLLFLLNLLGAFWIEPFSGSCMFVLMSYFQALIVILPLLLIKRFGVAAAVYLPYALLGVGFEYYFEWVVARVLLGPWYAVLWSLLGPLSGFLVDVVNRFLPRHIPGRWRAITLGVVLAFATFFLTRWGLTTFYVKTYSVGHLVFFQDKAVFSLPWMIVNAGFGGYTAYAMTHKA